MNIETFIQEWLTAANAFDTTTFLGKWHADAVLNDPSVGEIFKGHSGIKKYFEAYFIGYNTQTELVKLEIIAPAEAHIQVNFTGEFPGGKVSGIFDFVFKDNKIISAKADLI